MLHDLRKSETKDFFQWGAGTNVQVLAVCLHDRICIPSSSLLRIDVPLRDTQRHTHPPTCTHKGFSVFVPVCVCLRVCESLT